MTSLILAALIHTVAPNHIEWWNCENRVFTVQWRQRLDDGSWVDVGEGYDAFQHNNPSGFYRVLATDDVIFPVRNAGTSDLEWTATCPTLELECINTNIPPEWGEGYIVARGGNIGVGEHIITVTGGGRSMQCTITKE